MLRRRRQALRVQGQLPEGGSEEVRLRVDLQHFARHPGHHHAAPLPERVPVVGLHQEGPERVGDLVAHVRVGDVQAGENVALHLVPRLGGLGHALAAQHVGEDDRGGHDELHLLPTLLDQRPVHLSQPPDHVIGLQIVHFFAPVAHKLSQAPQQFRRGRLYDHLPRSGRPRNGHVVVGVDWRQLAFVLLVVHLLAPPVPYDVILVVFGGNVEDVFCFLLLLQFVNLRALVLRFYLLGLAVF